MVWTMVRWLSVDHVACGDLESVCLRLPAPNIMAYQLDICNLPI